MTRSFTEEKPQKCATCGKVKPVKVENYTEKKVWCSLKCSLEKG